VLKEEAIFLKRIEEKGEFPMPKKKREKNAGGEG